MGERIVRGMDEDSQQRVNGWVRAVEGWEDWTM
jgi:hypothetical protein